MKKIDISFIIPCYNCVNTLPDTISSIINLGLTKYEICMIDDSSTDSTFALLTKYKNMYPNIIKIGRNKKNMGGGFTRNKCVKLTKYNWLFLIDADNYLERKSFLNLIKIANKDDCLIAFQRISFFYDFFYFDVVYKTWEYLKDRMTFEDLRRTAYHPVVSGNYLFKKSVFINIKGYDAEFGALDTWSFGYKALIFGYTFKIVKNTKYFHRVDGKSYWIREAANNSNNLKKLLLKYPKKLSNIEIRRLQRSNEAQNILISKSNNFTHEHISSFFKLLLKIYYIILEIYSLNKKIK